VETTWTGHTGNEVLRKVKQHRNIQHKIKMRKANWISLTLSGNCLLRNVADGKIKEKISLTERQGRRRKQPLDDLELRVA